MSSVGVIVVVFGHLCVWVLPTTIADYSELTKCPDSFQSQPILYSKEAARMCLNITEEFLQRKPQNRIGHESICKGERITQRQDDFQSSRSYEVHLKRFV